MTQIEQALVEELVRLRHGWGLADDNLRVRLGPHLIELCGIAAEDNDRTIRNKVTTTANRLTASFPADDQIAAEIALGASPGHQYRLLSDRVTIIAQQLSCSERTARRRIDRAFESLAQEATAQRVFASDEAENDPEKGWYVRRLDALLRLDTPTPEVTETRTIVAQRADLKKIATRFTLPPAIGDEPAPRVLETDIAHGARIESRQREGTSHFRLLLDLPRQLARDEEHTYTIIFRLPPGQSMPPHYALIPLVNIDSFRVRIRYDADHVPTAVWRFDHLAPITLNDHQTPTSTLLTLDDANEVEQVFIRLEHGFAYGIAWQTATD